MLQVEDGISQFYPAQHADHVIASLDHSFDAGFDLRVEAYRKYYHRIRPRFENLFDPVVLFPEAEFDRVRVDARSARAEGVEVLLQHRAVGAWAGWLSYTWSQATDRIVNVDVPRRARRHRTASHGPWIS